MTHSITSHRSKHTHQYVICLKWKEEAEVKIWKTLSLSFTLIAKNVWCVELHVRQQSHCQAHKVVLYVIDVCSSEKIHWQKNASKWCVSVCQGMTLTTRLSCSYGFFSHMQRLHISWFYKRFVLDIQQLPSAIIIIWSNDSDHFVAFGGHL